MVKTRLVLLICLTAIFLIKMPQNIIEFLQRYHLLIQPSQPPSGHQHHRQFPWYQVPMHLCVGYLHDTEVSEPFAIPPALTPL
ncbi:hypothetical protein XELAEV_18006671mg [Xenopus laevis]|uniref:Secreted protein n=1 Tax=Xenopus laevis TaxID=8355 RepID=A0A974I4E5_XENLA|nr:hypothetical protein XELAEV_18006671mg [Xenopus laevis]